MTRRLRFRRIKTDRFAMDFGKPPADVGVAAALDGASLFPVRGENRAGADNFMRPFLLAAVLGSGRLNPCESSISAS